MTEMRRTADRPTDRHAKQPKESAEKRVRIQERRAATRSFICGYVDAYTLLSFGVFASFMTGNTTSAGVHAGQLKIAEAGHSLLPIPFFMLGIFSGTFAVQANPRRSLSRLSVTVSGLLTFVVVATHAGMPAWLNIIMLSFAMGLTNTCITKVGAQGVSLSYMTGDLNNLAQHLTEAVRRKPINQAQGSWDTPQDRSRILIVLWLSFFSGALVGAVLSPHMSVELLLLPAAVLLMLAYFEREPAVP
jgi:uncharacterized membrane protein YoaK (UPF0700 family)